MSHVYSHMCIQFEAYCHVPTVAFNVEVSICYEWQRSNSLLITARKDRGLFFAGRPAENTAFKLNGNRGRTFIVWSNMFEFVTLQIGADGVLFFLMPSQTTHIKSSFALFVEVSLYSVFILYHTDCIIHEYYLIGIIIFIFFKCHFI